MIGYGDDTKSPAFSRDGEILQSGLLVTETCSITNNYRSVTCWIIPSRDASETTPSHLSRCSKLLVLKTRHLEARCFAAPRPIPGNLSSSSSSSSSLLLLLLLLLLFHRFRARL